jgi:hypothetical protein
MHHFRRIALAGKIKNSKIFILNTPLLIEIFHFIFPNNKKKNKFKCRRRFSNGLDALGNDAILINFQSGSTNLLRKQFPQIRYAPLHTCGRLDHQ